MDIDAIAQLTQQVGELAQQNAHLTQQVAALQVVVLSGVAKAVQVLMLVRGGVALEVARHGMAITMELIMVRDMVIAMAITMGRVTMAMETTMATPGKMVGVVKVAVVGRMVVVFSKMGGRRPPFHVMC
jgi:propanediol dehydratase large subunit